MTSSLVGLAILGDDEGAIVVIVGHVLGDAVEDAAHLDGGAGRLDALAEHRGAIRLGEDRIGDVLADLARIDVPGSDDMDVAGAIAAEIPMHQADRVVRAVAIMRKPLDERAGAVANADDRDVDALHWSSGPLDM